MAQVVQSKGWIGPLITMVIGVILLLNGVPALIQWLPWIAQSAVIVGMDAALETAMVPLLLAGAATFIGFLMLRGGFGSLRQRARGAARRTQEQVRSGVQQVRSEASQRYQQASTQAEQLVSKTPGSWRERIQAAAEAVERERAARAVDHAHPEWEGQGARQSAQQTGQGQRMQQHGQQQPRTAQSWEQLQQGRPPHGQPQQAHPQQARSQQGQPPQGWQAQSPQRQQQAPGAERLSRIEELRQRVDSRTQQAHEAQDSARQAAEQARRAAKAAAERVQQGLPMHLDEATEALVGRLDLVDAERLRRRGSSLVRSSLTTGALSKTSLSLNSLLQHRR